jgi:hypothetical protein
MKSPWRCIALLLVELFSHSQVRQHSCDCPGKKNKFCVAVVQLYTKVIVEDIQHALRKRTHGPKIRPFVCVSGTHGRKRKNKERRYNRW